VDREELRNRAKRFALRIMKRADALPRSVKGRTLATQITRSATSAASGYRAACRARSRVDWIDKIGRTLEEVDESLLWLELISEDVLIPPHRLSALIKEAAELTAHFSAIHITSRSRPRDAQS